MTTQETKYLSFVSQPLWQSKTSSQSKVAAQSQPVVLSAVSVRLVRKWKSSVWVKTRKLSLPVSKCSVNNSNKAKLETTLEYFCAVLKKKISSAVKLLPNQAVSSHTPISKHKSTYLPKKKVDVTLHSSPATS